MKSASIQNKTINIEHLPNGEIDSNYTQRESGVFHTPYQMEVEFYSHIKNGDIDGLKEMMSEFFKSTLVVGRMSKDNLRQTKYFAVSCVTLATRYAILGGVDESDAYALSDQFILHIDEMMDANSIVSYLLSKAIELTLLVKKNQANLEYPHYIKKAKKYIADHLHERIKRRDVALFCGVSENYLSTLFEKYLNDGILHYIIKLKLEESKKLLLSGKSVSEISYIYGFCSQSHYISSFKKEYGQTPKQFANFCNFV